MRIRLFSLLIFSSLFHNVYSQNVTKSDLQGLWYEIYCEENCDFLDNLKFEKVHFQEPIYYDTLWICCDVDSNRTVDSLRAIDWSSATLSIANPDDIGGIQFQPSGYQPLEVFEIDNNIITFFHDIYLSDLVYTNQERKGNKKKFEEEKTKYKYLFKTEYALKVNKLSIKKYNSDIWSDDEILYFQNDTMIIRNSKQNFFSIYVRKKIEKEIDYKIFNVSLYQSYCFGSCPEFTFAISNSGKIFLDYEDSGFISKNERKNGNYIYQISAEQFNEMFDILKYLNFNKLVELKYDQHPHDSSRKIKFSLSNKKEIEVEDFADHGPVELRILNEMIYKVLNSILQNK